MNKADLINEVANVVSTKKEAQAAVDCVLESISQALKKDDVVTLVGFGTFKVVKRKARIGRNPQTGAEIKISRLQSPQVRGGQSPQGRRQLITSCTDPSDGRRSGHRADLRP